MTELNRRTFLAGTTAATVALASRRTARSRCRQRHRRLSRSWAPTTAAPNSPPRLLKLPGVKIAYICDCDDSAIEKGIAAATANGGPAPKGIKDFRTGARRQIRRRPHRRRAEPLARPRHDPRPAPPASTSTAKSRPAHARRRRTHDRRRARSAARRPNRPPAPQQPALRRSRRAKSATARSAASSTPARPTTTTAPRSATANQPRRPPRSITTSGKAPPSPSPIATTSSPTTGTSSGTGATPNSATTASTRSTSAAGPSASTIPTKVTATGSKLRYDDDQRNARYVHRHLAISATARMVWEGISWSPAYKTADGIEHGTPRRRRHPPIDDNGYKIYDPMRKLVEEQEGHSSTEDRAPRPTSSTPSATATNSIAIIEEGHKSTMLCHLGNIAYRTGQPLEIDPVERPHQKQSRRRKLWACEYRKGWFPGA